MSPPTKIRMLELCRTPRRYAELRDILGIKDPALQKHLKDLAYYGYLEKQQDGSYSVSEDGERLLQIALSAPDSVKVDETLFEAVNKKLRLAKTAAAYGDMSTPLQRLYNTFPIMLGPDKVLLKKEQVPVLRKTMSEILSRLDVRIVGADMDRMSEEHKERILNNMLDSLMVIMSYYKSSELAGRKYQASLTLDMTGIKEKDRKLMSEALFWVFKYRLFPS
jgi:predicted transcriptional regulator